MSKPATQSEQVVLRIEPDLRAAVAAAAARERRTLAAMLRNIIADWHDARSRGERANAA